MNGRRLRLLAAHVVLLAAVSGPACGGGPASPDAPVTPPATLADTGLIAYIDPAGCVARVTVDGTPVGDRFCAATRYGVSSMTWLDRTSIAYVTPEAQAVGWRMHDFATGADEVMPVAEAPKIRLIATVPQFRSVAGEIAEAGDDGAIYRVDGESRSVLFKTGDPSRQVRLANWSPDGEWLLLQVSVNRELWVVRRDGSGSKRIVESSKGMPSWFMPRAGGLPHLDFTCTTAPALDCDVSLQSPLPDAAVGNREVPLVWSACPGSTGYEVTVMGEGQETAVFTHITVNTAYRIPAGTLAPGGRWQWKVRVVIGLERGPWSETRTFATGAAAVGR